jgi:hypothetical protein
LVLAITLLIMDVRVHLNKNEMVCTYADVQTIWLQR